LFVPTVPPGMNWTAFRHMVGNQHDLAARHRLRRQPTADPTASQLDRLQAGCPNAASILGDAERHALCASPGWRYPEVGGGVSPEFWGASRSAPALARTAGADHSKIIGSCCDRRADRSTLLASGRRRIRTARGRWLLVALRPAGVMRRLPLVNCQIASADVGFGDGLAEFTTTTRPASRARPIARQREVEPGLDRAFRDIGLASSPRLERPRLPKCNRHDA